MCWCNPSLRTPQCGATDCVPPKQKEVSSYTPEERQLRFMLEECVILLTQGTEEHCNQLAQKIRGYLKENNSDTTD